MQEERTVKSSTGVKKSTLNQKHAEIRDIDIHKRIQEIKIGEAWLQKQNGCNFADTTNITRPVQRDSEW